MVLDVTNLESSQLAAAGHGTRRGAAAAPAGDRPVAAQQAAHRRDRPQHGTKTVFVWQPVPVFEYDLSQHFLYRDAPLATGDPVPNADVGRAYGLMAARRAELEGQGNLYVDRLHYTAKASGEIAGRILEFLTSASLLECPAAP